MNKLSVCKQHLSEILFAFVSVLTLALAVYGALCFEGWNAAAVIILAAVAQVCLGYVLKKYAKPDSVLQMPYTLGLVYFSVFAMLMLCCYFITFDMGNYLGLIVVTLIAMCLVYYSAEKLKMQDRTLLFKKCNEADYDPKPEPAEKLPYVYYKRPVEQKEHKICYYSPYLGKVREIPFIPRKKRGKPFDDVRGIKVADNLVVLRHILFTPMFPDDIREIAKQYEGRFPTKDELRQIYDKFNEINQNLYECGEPLLSRRKYLYTSGDENADQIMNYCLDFKTGQETLADCDSYACAVLVENNPPDSIKLEAELKAFRKKHLSKSDLCDRFDLLCVVEGHNVRLPFSKRHLGKPIGIFPFKNEPEYLELDEVENKKHTDKDVDEARLLDEHFCCARVSKIVNQLNIYLKALNKPVLEGSYLADSSYMKGCGWIIGFDNTGDYHGGNVPAKLRYMGKFYGECLK